MLKLTRPPARTPTGTFPIPGLQGATYTIGREAVLDNVPEIMRLDRIAGDIEGCGKKGRIRYDVKAVQVGTGDKVWIFDPRDEAQFQALRRIINDTDAELIFHNSPFDVPILSVIGVLDIRTVWRVVDTLVWARLAEPDERTRKTLSNCASRYLGMAIADPLPGIKKALGGISNSTWYQEFDLDSPAYRIMAASDVVLTYRIRDLVRKAAYERLTENHPFTKYGVSGSEAAELTDREQITNRQHLERSCIGDEIDPEYLDRYKASTEVEMRAIEHELEKYSIRPGNTGDLTGYLEQTDQLPLGYPRTKKTGKPSGTKDHLELLQSPVARKFVHHKEVTHILRDYLDKAADNAIDGRIHVGTSVLAAATGRGSMSGDAPYHQFNGPARGIVLADNWQEAGKGYNHAPTDECDCKNPKGMVSIDWSQIEPVVAANIAGDTRAIEYYEAGNKFYNALVEFGGMPYAAAKQTLLAQLYGQGINLLASKLNITPQEAMNMRDMVWKTLPGTKVLAGKRGKLQTIAERYKLVFTLSGRILPIPSGYRDCWDDHEDQDAIDSCRRCDKSGQIFNVHVHKGTNYFVQGSAYDVLAESMVKCIKAGLGSAIYFAMHDELIVDAEAAHDIRKIMETPPERLCMLANRTPKLRTDMAHLGPRWAKA